MAPPPSAWGPHRASVALSRHGAPIEAAMRPPEAPMGLPMEVLV